MREVDHPPHGCQASGRAPLLPLALSYRGATPWALRPDAANAVLNMDDRQNRRGSPPKLADHLVAREPVVAFLEFVSDEKLGREDPAVLGYHGRAGRDAGHPRSAGGEFIVKNQF